MALGSRARSLLSKAIWRRRKKEGGKGTCSFCRKGIFAGGAVSQGRPFHKACLGYAKMGFSPAQIGLNPRRPPRSLSVPEKHQLKIARKTLSYSDIGAKIMGGMTKEEAREIIYRLVGRHPKDNPKGDGISSNPGAEWHRRRTDELRNRSRRVDDSRMRRLMWNLENENKYAADASQLAGIPNPRPPAGWWANTYPRVRASYPGASRERVSRICAGVWWNLPKETRERIIRKYD